MVELVAFKCSSFISCCVVPLHSGARYVAACVSMLFVGCHCLDKVVLLRVRLDTSHSPSWVWDDGVSVW